MKQKSQKLNNYYATLPVGFEEDYVVDAQKKSFIIVFNILAIVIMVAVAVITYFLKFIQFPYDELLKEPESLIVLLVFIISMFAYLVLHELTHGLVYKLMTKQKLTFGLTLTVAYCGLKEGYTNKKTSLLALLAPFVVHSLWMVLLIIFLNESLWTALLILLFAIHFGGCIGDLYDTFILLIRYHNKDVLMNDTGPKQTFYVLK
jgi:hypothetical protein